MSVADLTIRSLGPQGDGIAMGSQGRIYVDRALPGEYIKAKIKRDASGTPRAEIIKILEPSLHRQEAPCKHYDACGNCTLQHADDSFYRKWKTETVKEALSKVGLFPKQWEKPVFVGENSRRRVTFTAVKHRNKITLGYYKRRSSEITDISSCLIADPILLELREEIKTYLLPVLLEAKPVDIFFQLVGKSVDMVITGQIGRNLQSLSDLIEDIIISRISIREDEKSAVKTLFSKEPVIAKFGNLHVNLPPAAFLQPTLEGEKVLVSTVMDFLPKTGKFADLFSGCGTFTGPLLERGAVDAFESAPLAVSALTKAVGKNPLKVFKRDLFKNPLRRDDLKRYDAIVFDPPRAGCPEQADWMASSKVKTLIGVSCNPISFARDARILCDGGYRLQNLKVVDQFHYSHHVEVVGLFTK